MMRLPKAVLCRGAPPPAGLGLALLVFASLGGAVQAAPESLRIGIFGREPPLSFIDPAGEPRGFDIDVAHALCAQLRAQCELVPTDWVDLIPQVQSGALDAAVASLSVTAARRAKVGFTRPYHAAPARFVARAGRFAQADAETLKGQRVGVRRGTTFDDYLTSTYPDQVRLVRYGTTDDALVDLLLGRLDLVLGDQILLDQGFLRQEQGRGFAFAGEPPTDPDRLGEGVGVAVRPDGLELRARLDQAVADLVQHGVLARLAHRWLGNALPASAVGAPPAAARPGPTPRP